MEDLTGESVTVDVLVVGAGVGGLSAAMSAGLAGLKVLVVEKTDCFGGTGARAGGVLWVPLNYISVRDGIADSIDEARAYVAAEAGPMFNPVVVDSYLANAPHMVETYAKHFPFMQFVRNDVGADNHPRQPGAKDKGRSLSVPPLDGRVLGKYRNKLAPPLETMTFLGMMIPSRDILHFFNIWRSRASFNVVSKRLLAHAKDLLTCGQTMQIANGAALVSRMAKSAFDLGVPFWFNAPARELLTENGRVIGAVVMRDGRPVPVHAQRGVVLATGGYPHDKSRRLALAPIASLSTQLHSAASPAAQGDGLRMAEAVGGQVENRLFNTLSWWPVSRVPRNDGSSVVFPHMVDRSKPGFIMVSRSGRRFERETAIGNDIVRAMASAAGDGAVEAWLIGDSKAVRRFGIGIARPAPIPLGRHLRSGYVLRGRTLAELGTKAGIDVSGLERQVQSFNVHAARGEDPEFHRGESALEKRAGDPEHKPNPSLRPLDTPPYYAVKILPGDFSTLAGLRTDGCARVLNDAGQPIAGLYAAGNDLSTMAGGHSPAAGFTIGAAVTFGFIAGQHLGGKL
jgi:succinate dehydrogenase/fumarate reductase flavoprotein subunit